jgi:hypothetical protein
MGITSDASGNGSAARIRLATERDAEQIAAIYAPNVTDTIISFELEPPTADEMRRRIEVTLERYPGWSASAKDGCWATPAPARTAPGRPIRGPWTCRSTSTRTHAGRGGASPVHLTLRGAGPPGLL